MQGMESHNKELCLYFRSNGLLRGMTSQFSHSQSMENRLRIGASLYGSSNLGGLWSSPGDRLCYLEPEY